MCFWMVCSTDVLDESLGIQIIIIILLVSQTSNRQPHFYTYHLQYNYNSSIVIASSMSARPSMNPLWHETLWSDSMSLLSEGLWALGHIFFSSVDMTLCILFAMYEYMAPPPLIDFINTNTARQYKLYVHEQWPTKDIKLQPKAVYNIIGEDGKVKHEAPSGGNANTAKSSPIGEDGAPAGITPKDDTYFSKSKFNIIGEDEILSTNDPPAPSRTEPSPSGKLNVEHDIIGEDGAVEVEDNSSIVFLHGYLSSGRFWVRKRPLFNGRPIIHPFSIISPSMLCTFLRRTQ